MILPGVDVGRATESWSWIRGASRLGAEVNGKEKSLTRAMLVLGYDDDDVLRFGVLKITFKPFLLYSYHPHFSALSLSISLLLDFSFLAPFLRVASLHRILFLYPPLLKKLPRLMMPSYSSFMLLELLSSAIYYYNPSQTAYCCQHISGLPFSLYVAGIEWMLEWT